LHHNLKDDPVDWIASVNFGPLSRHNEIPINPRKVLCFQEHHYERLRKGLLTKLSPRRALASLPHDAFAFFLIFIKRKLLTLRYIIK